MTRILDLLDVLACERERQRGDIAVSRLGATSSVLPPLERRRESCGERRLSCDMEVSL